MEGEKHRSVASHTHPAGNLAHTTQACALTGNQTSDPLVHRPALNPLSHTSQGWIIFYSQGKPGEWDNGTDYRESFTKEVIKCQMQPQVHRGS